MGGKAELVGAPTGYPEAWRSPSTAGWVGGRPAIAGCSPGLPGRAVALETCRVPAQPAHLVVAHLDLNLAGLHQRLVLLPSGGARGQPTPTSRAPPGRAPRQGAAWGEGRGAWGVGHWASRGAWRVAWHGAWHCLRDARPARLGRRELGPEAREHGAVRLEEGAAAHSRLFTRRLHQRILREPILREEATVEWSSGRRGCDGFRRGGARWREVARLAAHRLRGAGHARPRLATRGGLGLARCVPRLALLPGEGDILLAELTIPHLRVEGCRRGSLYTLGAGRGGLVTAQEATGGHMGP